MSAFANYFASLPGDAEEVDLSSFELMHFDAGTWKKLRGLRETMKRVKLPPSLVTIKRKAFMNFEQLTGVTFPSSLRSIEDSAFKGCSGLAVRDLKLPNKLRVLGTDAFNGCSALTGKLSTHIAGLSSFCYCTGISELDLGNRLKEIEKGCFAGCVGLIGQLELPPSLKIIRKHAFRDCTGLNGPLMIPPFVKHIHPEAFLGCTGLINIDQTIEKHSTSFESWKARGNVLMTLIKFDKEYRRVVEKNGGTLRSALSNSFLSDYSNDAQLIYKAGAHVDGTDNLANGICRLIISFLPMDRSDYGT
jgi:hypothetical protein